MKKLQKSLSVLLVLALLFSFAAPAARAEDSENFDFIQITGGARITHYGGSERDVVIPAYVVNGNGESLPVREVDGDVFAYSDVRSVTFPDTVTKIVAEQFTACTSLESVQFGSSISTIGVSAFWECTALQSFTIPDSVQTIGAGAFRDCTALETVTIGSGVTALPGSLFDMCTSLRTVYCGANTQSVDSTTFLGCFTEGGDLYIYDETTDFALDVLTQDFTGTVHCYPDSPIDGIVSEFGYNIAYFTFDKLYATTDAPLQVIEDPQPQAVPAEGLQFWASYTDENSVVPPRNVTEQCSFEKTMVFDAPGVVPVRVTYKTYSGTFDVTVLENIETGIEIVSAPNKGTYYTDDEAQTVSTEGLRVELCYRNGKRVDVTADCVVPATQVFDTVGTQYVAVTYNGHETAFAVNVLQDVVTGLEIASGPTKTVYYASPEAQTVQTAGLRVDRVHISGKRVDVTVDCTVPATQVFDTVGADAVYVTYGGFSVPFAVTVLENVETGIEIVSAPNKTFYYTDDQPQSILTDGLQVNLCFINGQKKNITGECDIPAQMLLDAAGTKTVPVQYKTFTASFAVTVLENTPTGIEVVSLPLKTTYLLSGTAQTVSTEGLRVELCYRSGKRVDVTADCIVEDRQLFDRVGTAYVMVSYGSFVTRFAVTVQEDMETGIRIAALPTDTLYYAADTRQTVDTEGLRVLLCYASGAEKDVTDLCAVPATQYFPTAGQANIPVQYNGFTAQIPVTVKAVTLQLTDGSAAVSGLYKKKISLFSSYKKNPVTFGYAGLEPERVQSVQWEITEGAMTVRDGTVTYGKLLAGTGVVSLTVTDIHGAVFTVQTRVIFYRLNIQLPLQFSRYL
ncbi:MAG: leucine-rich repeat domain-containing protein [Acutalibacteraceae bacterium]